MFCLVISKSIKKFEVSNEIKSEYLLLKKYLLRNKKVFEKNKLNLKPTEKVL